MVRLFWHTPTLSLVPGPHLMAQAPAPAFTALVPPQKLAFDVVLTLGGDVNGNKMKN